MQPSDIVRSIGLQVRAGRKRIGITRKQLAVAAGVSERYLNELENGEANASVGILVKVAGALGQDFPSLVTPGGNDAATPAQPRPTDDSLMAMLATMSPAEQAGALPIMQQYLEQRRRSAKGVALLGLRGAGKSTLGGSLAEKHGLAFVSVTREIESRAGMTLGDLFNLGGPDAYRALECEVIAELCQRDDRIVLETAGGIAGNGAALDMIFASFKTVWLTASPEEHLARVAGQGDTRPMRGNPKALDQLKALLLQRESEYARAEHTIDTSGRTSEACLADLEQIAAPILALQAEGLRA